jgi:hypothetical protein
MRKIMVFMLAITLAGFAVLGAWAKYNYGKNIETAAQSKEELIGIGKNDVFAKFGRPVAWGALADKEGQRRKEVLLYTTWTKNVVIVLQDDKVVSVKFHDVQRSVLKQARSFLNMRSWFSTLERLVTGESETGSMSI